MSYAQKLRLPQQGSYLHDPSCLSSLVPPSRFLSPGSSTLSSSSSASVFVFAHTAGGEGSLCFCFNDIFSLRISGEPSSSEPLAPYRPSPATPLSAASIPSATRRESRRISSSGDFVDYNKCVCSSRRIERPVALLLSLVLRPLVLLTLPHHSPPAAPSLISDTSVWKDDDDDEDGMK